jgi:hypothetical protein
VRAYRRTKQRWVIEEVDPVVPDFGPGADRTAMRADYRIAKWDVAAVPPGIGVYTPRPSSRERLLQTCQVQCQVIGDQAHQYG